MALGLVGRRHPLVVVSPQDVKIFEIWTLGDPINSNSLILKAKAREGDK
jgi:hypothetical protein